MADLKNMNNKLNVIEGIERGTPIGLLETNARIDNIEANGIFEIVTLNKNSNDEYSFDSKYGTWEFAILYGKVSYGRGKTGYTWNGKLVSNYRDISANMNLGWTKSGNVIKATGSDGNSEGSSTLTVLFYKKS